jgi:hypothetical protein
MNSAEVPPQTQQKPISFHYKFSVLFIPFNKNYYYVHVALQKLLYVFYI